MNDQTLSDYISAINGDTLVLKDYNEMDNQASNFQSYRVILTIVIIVNRIRIMIIVHFQTSLKHWVVKIILETHL